MTRARPLIVILEDDPASAEALKLILSDWGAEVVHGAQPDTLTGELAARASDIHCIITDFHLGPGADGVSLTQKLAVVAPQARVLVLSGSSHGRANIAAAEAGFEIMRKPAQADAIVAWLERV